MVGRQTNNQLAVPLRHFDNDALHFGVSLQAVLAQLAADAGHFEATERRLRFQNVVAVDPDSIEKRKTNSKWVPSWEKM